MGKTTTTRLTSHLMCSVGYKVGMTCSDGVYIMNRSLMTVIGRLGVCSSCRKGAVAIHSADWKLHAVDRAPVGSASQHRDVAIVTNVAADHLGLEGHPHAGGTSACEEHRAA